MYSVLGLFGKERLDIVLILEVTDIVEAIVP